MQTTTKTEPIHIPDKALHLATDCSIRRALRTEGHEVRCTNRIAVAIHKDTKVTAAWSLHPYGEAHPLSYRAQIIRALVILGFFAILAIALL